MLAPRGLSTASLAWYPLDVRQTTTVLGLVVALAIGVALGRFGSPRSHVEPAASAAPAAPSPSGAASTALALLDDPLFAAPAASRGRASGARDPLPASAPRAVRFGVVLVLFRGAEEAPAGTRSKAAALELARSIAEDAPSDFRRAVARGDLGSTEDAGRMPQGVLEPELERALFSLEKGGVAGPFETSRGYWIVRRND